LQKNKSLRLIILIFLIFVVFNNLNSQDGAQLYVGTLNVSVPNEPNTIRPGFNVGGQGKIGSPGFFMAPGLIFQKFTVDPFDKNRYYNDRPSYSMIKLTTDGGYEYKILKFLKVRIFAGVSLNYVISIDENTRGINFNNLYDANFSYDYGAGISLWFITLDFKRDNNLTDFFKDVEKKGISFNCINIGISF
jgi:hypothetical protein